MKDNLSIGAIAKFVNKLRCVVHGVLKVYNDYGSSEAKHIHLNSSISNNSV